MNNTCAPVIASGRRLKVTEEKYNTILSSCSFLCAYCLELNGADCSACYVSVLLDAANEAREKTLAEEEGAQAPSGQRKEVGRYEG